MYVYVYANALTMVPHIDWKKHSGYRSATDPQSGTSSPEVAYCSAMHTRLQKSDV